MIISHHGKHALILTPEGHLKMVEFEPYKSEKGESHENKHKTPRKPSVPDTESAQR